MIVVEQLVKTVLFRIISIVRVLPLLHGNAKHNSHDELQNCFLSGKLGIFSVFYLTSLSQHVFLHRSSKMAEINIKLKKA